MGKKYCEVCTKKCKSFAIKIDDNIYVHSDCFRCQECRGELELSKFYFKNKRLYCIKDFKKLYYPKCVKCSEVIEDEMVKVMGQQYHLNCLCCSFCKATSKHGDKLNFDGKNLICRECTLLSLRVQSITKMSSNDKTLPDEQKETKPLQNVNNNHNSSSPTSVNQDKRGVVTDLRGGDTSSGPRMDSRSPTGKPPMAPNVRTSLRTLKQANNIGYSSSSPQQKSPNTSCDEDVPHVGGSYLDRPSSFRRGPSFNVSHTSTNIHHFHLPENVEGMQKFTRLRSRTLPKGSVFKPSVGSFGSSVSKSPPIGDDHVFKGVSPPLAQPKSPPGKVIKKEERATSRDTLSKTPLPCISEDGMSLTSHTSIHLPSKGYALKPGYGLKPIMYACYGTNPDAKHVYTGAVSMEDSKDTKSISLGSDCYGSFHSGDEEERLDPYTGLKRSRSVRSTASCDPRSTRSRTLMEVISNKRPITVGQFLRKVEQNEGNKGDVKKYTYGDLKTMLSSANGSKLINRQHLEDHLIDEEFDIVFSMSRVQFQQLPEWKRADLKRRRDLF